MIQIKLPRFTEIRNDQRGSEYTSYFNNDIDEQKSETGKIVKFRVSPLPTTLIKVLTLLLVLASSIHLTAQLSIEGIIHDDQSSPLEFSNIVLYSFSDSTLIKVESSDEEGKFSIKGIAQGKYYVVSSHIGYDDYYSSLIDLSNTSANLGILQMKITSVELETAVIKAKRALVEVKADRMVFNVGGTINSAGGNALGLLRKAPGVIVDNNNNISVLSRSGVIVYIDGKRLPLNGDDLTTYLNNLPAEQIDRIDLV